jgi:hypothetical protein
MSEISNMKRAGGVAQVVESLTSKNETLSLISSTTRKTKKLSLVNEHMGKMPTPDNKHSADEWERPEVPWKF